MKRKKCEIHGELTVEQTRIFLYKGYTRMQCRECNKTYDKNKKRTETYRQRRLEKSRTPEEKEKARIRAIAYRARRRIVAKAAYQRKKDDPEFIKARRESNNRQYQKMKEEFNDNYIKKLLRIYKDATPEQLIYKRQEILEFRRIRAELKKQREIISEKKAQRKKYIEENGIVKTCKIHGDLKKEDTYFASNGKKCLNKIFVCRKCHLDKSQKTYEKNRDLYQEKHRKYANDNKASVKERNKRYVDNLADKYVAKLIIKNTGIKFEDIDPKLIDLKRTLIQIKRKIKGMK